MINDCDNSEFDKMRFGGWSLHVNKTFPGDELAQELARGFNGGRGPFSKIDASCTAKVLKCNLSMGGKLCTLFFKQYYYRSLGDFVKHIFRRSRAMRSQDAAQMLAENGLNAPMIAATGEYRVLGCVLKSFSITHEISGAEDLYAYSDKKMPLQERRDFVMSLGKAIGKMHRGGISHGDLRPGNVFANKSEKGWDFYFLDNERTVRYRKLPKKLRAKNLVQINMIGGIWLSNTDRMRFYKHYILQNEAVSNSWKELGLAVSVRTAERLQKKK